MVTIPTCKNCGKKVYGQYTSDGLCHVCNLEKQDELEREKINMTSFPDGFIATWMASPSFLDRKNNYMYFRIPERQRLFFDPDETYQIIVKKLVHKNNNK